MNDPAARRRLTGVLRGRTRSRDAAAEPAAPESAAPPVLSVVIPVYNVAPYLAECLDSVLGQSLSDLEVIAVDDGSTDDCPAILERYAAADPRLRVLTQENAGQGAARNHGVDAARGTFLTFVDSDDTVPRRAFKAMVRTLRASGSDFVVGAAVRTRHNRTRGVAWGRTVHEYDRLATTIDEFPAAMQDIIACNRVFRTAFWRDRVGGFGSRTAYEDHVPMLAAYVRAERFDVLARVTYQWRMREDQTSTGQQKAVLQNLLDRITVKEEAHDLLRAEASEATYDAWVGRCLDIDFPPFLPHALVGTDDYRDALATTYRLFLDRATERALRTVRHDRAVRAWLCAERRWDDLDLADEHFRTHRQPEVRAVGDRLVAVPDLPAEISAAVPPGLWALADSETALRTGLRAVEVDGTTVRVSVWALVPGLGTPDGPPEVEAWLVDPGSGSVVDLRVAARVEPEVDQWAEDDHATYPHSAFDATVDLADLLREASTTWTLRLRLRQGDVVREGGVYDAVDGSPAQLLSTRVADLDGAAVEVAPGWDPAGGFRLRVAPGDGGPADAAPEPGLRVQLVEHAPGELVVEALATGSGDTELAAARWRGQHLDLAATTVEGSDPVRLRFPTTTTPPSGRYTLVAPTPDGGELEATAARDLARTLPRSRVDPELRLTTRLRSDGALVAVVGAPLDDEERRPDVQQRWRRAHQARSTPPDAVPHVLLQPAGGRADETSRALDAALAATHAEVGRTWAVRDHSIVVPDGTGSVLLDSRRWHDLLAASPLLWSTDDLPTFFVKHPQQRTLRTFSGFPTVPIGTDAWRARGQNARAVALEVERRRQQWDHLVAPTEEVAALYREAFELDDRVLVTGSPHTDDLVTRDRDHVRATVLARLGIPAERTVVLHAPERRDRATRALLRSAPSADLDVRRLAAALGPGHVLLTLGVRRPGPPEAGAAPVVDVTLGPPVNDLLLAADAAVLDYSSLRFDWALTGRPAVLHVPDHDARLEALPSPVDLDATAAGPQVGDLDDVVDALRDLGGLQERYAAAVDDLNRTHNALHDGRAGARVVKALLG
ncbi:hypothetical protein GCM10009795_049550 [Nocardioides hankookensis]|uniref:CDP-glycerol glycerophosphotransferase family protein n=1 Tax=Nocardioides hankookensis TaxID=443157 RepID=A0ABW1LGD5_9ACTN